MELKSNTRKFVQMQITPVMAKEMLAANKVNRRLDYHAVDRYARDMMNGNWHLTTDCIGFNKVGQLINGQHRLVACSKSNTPFMAVVAFGLDDDSMAYVDSGKLRSEKDRLAIMHGGVREVPVLYRQSGVIAFTKLLCCYLTGKTEIRNFTVSEVNEAISENEPALNWIYRKFMTTGYGKLTQDRSFMFALLAARIGGVSEEELVDFVSFANRGELLSGKSVSAYNVGVAHMYMVNREKAVTVRDTNAKAMTHMIEKVCDAETAIYCFVNKTKTCRKKTASGEAYPFTKEMLNAFNEEMKAEYSAERK